MANNDFVYCSICRRSYVWVGNKLGCPWCSEAEQYEFPQFPDQTFTIGGTEWNIHKKEETMQRKYLPTLSDLIDRLTIVQQKELKIPEHREEYTKELEDLMHDIQICLGDNDIHTIDAEMIRDVIVLTLMNCEIWHNESNFRKGIKDGNNLELTHGLNGIRNTAKNKIQGKFGGRKDYKVDNVKAFENWVPSGYKKEEEK
jgi:hypothetical protein